MHLSPNEEKWQLIKDSVDREPALSRKLVPQTESSTREEQEDMRYAAYGRSITRKPKELFQLMSNNIRWSLSNFVSFDDQQDGEE
jgi:hypothetical protein